MHAIQKLIREVNATHKGLGPMIGLNVLCAKAKKCVLNIAPAGCGKSVTTDTTVGMLRDYAKKFTSLTLAGLTHLKLELQDYHGHIVIDDLGGEKINSWMTFSRYSFLHFCPVCLSQSDWSRVSTITVLANLVHTHFVRKVTQGYIIEISGFEGSAALNIQPVMLSSLVADNDWISVVRDKVLRYYHLFRPVKPKPLQKTPTINFDIPLHEVEPPAKKGKLWYQLVAITLTQWSYGRIMEHVPPMLQACAALDSRHHILADDYYMLIKLLRPMQLERYIVQSFGLETSRVFDDNLYCMLVEIATHGNPSIETICEDYKVAPVTVDRVAQTIPDWVWTKKNSPKRIMPTEMCQNILKLCGVNQKW